jgi:hypothetical protein
MNKAYNKRLMIEYKQLMRKSADELGFTVKLNTFAKHKSLSDSLNDRREESKLLAFTKVTVES